MIRGLLVFIAAAALLTAAYIWLMDAKAAENHRWERVSLFSGVVSGVLAENADTVETVKREFWRRDLSGSVLECSYSPAEIIANLWRAENCVAADAESPARGDAFRRFQPLSVTVSIAPSVWRDARARDLVIGLLRDRAATCSALQRFGAEDWRRAKAGCGASSEPIEIFVVVRSPPYRSCRSVPSKGGGQQKICDPLAPALHTQRVR